MDLDKAFKERHSVKKFNSKKPDWRDIIEAIDAARYAPMAGGNFSLKFIVVSEPEKISEIAQACQQNFVSEVSYVIVACSVPGRTTNSYGKQGEAYVRQQAGAAMENFLLKITDLGLSTCWVGYFVENQIKRILQIPDNTQVEAVFPIGYEYERRKTRKASIDMDSILYFNKYGEKRMHPLKKMNV